MRDDLAGLDLTGLLGRLEPVPEPPPVSLWPQTIGWVWIGVALLFGLAWFGRRWYRHYRRNAYRRAALAAIGEAGDDPAAIADILRRTALAAFPRTDVAGLYGEQWLAFLDDGIGGAEFRTGVGRSLASAPYVALPAKNPALAQLAERWIRTHASVPSFDD